MKSGTNTRCDLCTSIMVCFLFLTMAMLSGCSEKEESAKIDPALYADWEKYDYGHFAFRFSPNSVFTTGKAKLAKNYERFLTEICAYLEIPVPDEKITLYVYALGIEDRDITGRQTPFSDDSTIHWGNKYPYGYELTKFLLRKSGYKPGDFEVVNEGIPFLLDFSSHNYHDKTNRRNNSDSLISLVDLGDSQIFDTVNFVAKRAESASLCGFIMYNYGLDRLFMLAESSVDWRRSIETIFQMPLEDFEQTWLLFAREMSNEPEGLLSNDPDQDLQIIKQIDYE